MRHRNPSGGNPSPPSRQSDPELTMLRERILQIDRELIERAAERVRLAREAGELKRRRKLPTVDYAQERIVVERAREVAGDLGLDPGVAEALLDGLIRASVTAQDEDRLRLAAAGVGKTAVVVGGAGRMGRWMVSFLSSQGYTTGVLDPGATPEENLWARRELAAADLVVSSTPPAATAELYTGWIHRPPSGVVVDIASIKTPLIGPIAMLQEAGARVASIHPMFGPSTVLLREADVVICDTGDAQAGEEVAGLFAPTTAHIVHLPLSEHDRIMADLLSLSHVTAISFALALPKEEHPVRSTTFRELESLASTAVRESPDVYYEIQAMNPHSSVAVARLRGALDRIVRVIGEKSQEGFRDLIEDGRLRTPETE